MTESLFERLQKKALQKNPDLHNPNAPGSVCWTLGLSYYPSYNDGNVVGLNTKNPSILDLLELQTKLTDVIGNDIVFRVISGEWAD